MKLALIMLFIVFVSGCATTTNQQALVNSGHACMEEPKSFPTDRDVTFLCLFELNQGSPFYSKEAREKVLSKFIETAGKHCKASESWEMQNHTVITDHDASLIAYRVICK